MTDQTKPALPTLAEIEAMEALLLAAARELLQVREVVAVVNGDGGHGSPQDAIDRHYAICAERDALKELTVAIDDDIRATLKSTRDALGAGAVEHVVDAAKRVMAELDEVRQKAARDHEADRRMRDALKAEVERLRATPTGDLADAASALAETRAQLERANGDLARLRADALSVGGGAVRKAYMLKDRDEDYRRAAEERDALKTEVERLRAHLSTAEGRVASCGNYFCKEGRHVGACPRASTPPPSPSPLDPRALVIYGGAVQVWAAIPRANVFSVADQVFEAAEILRAAEAEAKKGVGK